MRTFETAIEFYGADVRYRANTIDEAMEQFISDVVAMFPEVQEQFDSVRIENGEVVSQYPDQGFDPGTVFLIEVEED